MPRATIDIGIDLGTTNSAVAVMQQGVPFVVDSHGSVVTPSVVHIDQAGKLTIGKRAYERIISNPDETAWEFKRRMGTSDAKTFPGTGRQMTAPQLSAEILKILRTDV
ncbi:MAG TPA: Hsp70 family protein, partial [Herpetosiphonaceae bacterium]|nr:Hsp70 family protein [Herpetosiphonaceae bacterium]